jgi:hypothetical protein
MDKGNVDPTADLPELDTLTIRQLKELGHERGYDEVWCMGKKKADYIEWLRSQHNQACIEKDPDPVDVMVQNLRANQHRLDERKEEYMKQCEEMREKRHETLVKVADLESRREKTHMHYEAIIMGLKLIIKLNESISCYERAINN